MKKTLKRLMQEIDRAIEPLPHKQRLALLDGIEEFAFLRGHDLEVQAEKKEKKR